MRDGGKGDKPRPLTVTIEQFDKNFDAIFGKKKLDAVTYVNTKEYMDVSYHKNGVVTTVKVKK